jgi:gluconate 2-dehydrogenase gamma chain
MFLDPASRRAFLRVAGSTGAAWLLADAALIREAFAHAVRQRGRSDARFESLASGMAEDLEAVVARIIPSDGSPGAREAGVIHFIDRSLATFAAGQKPLLEEGIADLNRRAAVRWPGTPSFAALAAERQDELLHDIEKSDFFQAVRFATLAGMFADPSWGGNRDHLGWTLIGQGHEPFYQPPFGWYDADVNGRR